MLKTAESPCITEGKYGNQLELFCPLGAMKLEVQQKK